MSYGRMGPVNYIRNTVMEDGDILSYKTLPPKKVPWEQVAAAQADNLFTITSSAWRMVSPAAVVGKVQVSEWDDVQRRVECVYLDYIFPDLHNYPHYWEKYGKEIFEKNKIALEHFGNMMRRVGCSFVFLLRQGVSIDPTIAKTILRFWNAIGLPQSSQKHHIRFRLFMFSSSIPKDGWEKKAKYIKQSLAGKIAIIADDISLVDCIRLAKETGARATYTIDVRRKDGGIITFDSLEWKAMVKHTWKDHPGSSGFIPTVFMRKKYKLSSQYRVAKHFSNKTVDVVFY